MVRALPVLARLSPFLACRSRVSFSLDHRAMTSSLGYNISLGSQSPVFTYLPLRDAAEDSGWNASYTGTTHAQAYNGGLGVGTAYRETQLDGASVALNFTGTAIYLCLGLSSYPSTSQLTVDGITWEYSIDQGSDSVCEGYDGADSVVVVDQLSEDVHGVILTVNVPSPGDFVRFFGATILVSNGPLGFPLSPTTVSWKDPGWTYAPGDLNWHSRADKDLLGNNTAAIGDLTGGCMWGHVVDPSTIASITISNTTAFYLLGPVGDNFANYTVAFNGDNTTFVAINYFAAYQQVLYFASGLDPGQQYELQVQDWDPSNPKPSSTTITDVAIDALVLLKPTTTASDQPSGASTSYPPFPSDADCTTCLPPGSNQTYGGIDGQGGPSSTASSKVPALVGGIAGGVVLLAVITVLLTWRRIRRWLRRGQLDMAGEETLLRHSRSQSTQAQPYHLSGLVLPHGTSNQRPAVTIRTKDLPLQRMSTNSVISISPRWTEKQPPSRESPLTFTTSGTRAHFTPSTATSSRPDLLHTVPLSDLVSHLNQRLQHPGTSAESSAPPEYE
ncbi:hypothetical protein CALVIDRAFT_599225 [Calocera viscosa TUFC12733]|uniref:Uncharacterized protein n=1 Tax=Calocera viscosa (strain TUFC12733) TaxID=1330018 RepID=A0A167L8I5_CALVF|nr:hypothetical protein CALVIDRAFT_599225 [Calocera viscosa TUFC12733]